MHSETLSDEGNDDAVTRKQRGADVNCGNGNLAIAASGRKDHERGKVIWQGADLQRDKDDSRREYGEAGDREI